MCLGKALTGGYLSLAATLCTPEVAAGIRGGELPVLAHGPTFMGNPLACAIANASVGCCSATRNLAIPEAGSREVTGSRRACAAGLAPARDLPGVADVRVLGAIGVVQLDHEVDLAAATRAAVAEGVWLRPFRDLVYTMPPYVTGDADLGRICVAVCAAAAAG